MVTDAEMKKVIERWKRAIRPLKIHEQKYGEHLVRVLERYDRTALPSSNDYLEVVIFTVFLELLKEMDPGREYTGA